jgi:DNA polymerase-3 subunit delta
LNKIKERILTQPLARLYIIHGENQYLQKEIYTTLQRRAEQDGILDWNWVNLTPDKELQPADVMRELQTTPWGGGTKIIALTDADVLDAEFLNKLADGLAKATETNCLALFFNKLDRRLKAVKGLLKLGVEVECLGIKGENLVRWVLDYLRLRDKKMPQPAVQKFLAKVGTDLNLIANELDKLILYTGDEATITEDDVFAVTSTPPDQLEHGGIFDLTDAVSARDVDQALTILTQLLDAKEPPLRILPLIERQLRLLLAAKTRGRMSISAAAQAMGENSDYALKQAEKYKNKFTLEELYSGLQQIVAADNELKFGADPYQTMEQLIINICL